ncbi:MAG TPA: hypothetical protein PK977_05215, partial [Chitinophagaceae bacterium]|nr:hypothetical protein [Chitinophagaceae bacterium]
IDDVTGGRNQQGSQQQKSKMKTIIRRNILFIQRIVNAGLEQELRQCNKDEIGQSHQFEESGYQSHGNSLRWKDTTELLS